MTTTPDETPDDMSPDGVALGMTEGGSTFEPEEDDPEEGPEA